MREKEWAINKAIKQIKQYTNMPVRERDLEADYDTATDTIVVSLPGSNERVRYSLDEYRNGVDSQTIKVQRYQPFERIMNSSGNWWDVTESLTTTSIPKDTTAQDLKDAKEAVKTLTEILERVQKEPLMLQTIDRISKDKKHIFIKKGDIDLRIEAVKDIKRGDEVLLHPKTMQIVEHLGKPPLEASRFAPDKIPNVTWDAIGGLEQAKSDMIEAIEMPHLNKDLFKYYNKKQIKGILLSGPPGCGKTMLGKAAANSLSKTYGKENSRTGFLYVKGPEILNQYVGQTEQTIRDMFFDAQRHKEEHGYPAIIFLDEADAILAARGSRNIGIGNTIVPMFLNEMDGLEESSAIVIIATNRPDVLDPAIVRDGRIDRKIVVTRPSMENAVSILTMNLRNVPISKEYDINTMAEDMATLIYSDDRFVGSDKRLKDIVNGAMLANCVDIAVSYAIRRDIVKKKKSGLLPEDLIAGIDRIQSQSMGVRHDLLEVA